MMLELICKATLLAGVAGVVALALRRASAAARHVVWLSCLSALVLLPLAALITPAWRPALEPAAFLPQVARTVIVVSASGPAQPIPMATIALLIWGGVALLLIARLIVGQQRVAALIRTAMPYRHDAVLSPDTDVPLVCGLLRPVVLLPVEAVEWTEARRAVVVRHEAAHAARFDPLAQVVADLACALYWPLPWVWLASRQLRMEAELACDDGVLRSGECASDYAGHLIDIVRGLSGRERIPQGGIPMARLNQLEVRLRSLLARNVNRGAASPRTLITAALGALMLMVPLAAVRMPAFALTGGVSGTVKDPSGATVPKAKVVVSFTDSTRREVGYTNDVGEFSLAPIPDGTYNVSVAKPGFALLELKGIPVVKGESAPLQIILQTGKVTETVNVSGTGTPAVAPPPVPSGEPKRILVGGNVQGVKLIKKAMPSYPAECKAAGIQGSVMFKAVISKEGDILNLTQINQIVDRRLVDAATEAVKQWKYQPTLLNGNPVEVITEIDVNFTLSQ
ncbi:MAG TPA: M56 family metallopeptidase [Paludibaculum sp.]|jgi:TonB family protein